MKLRTRILGAMGLVALLPVIALYVMSLSAPKPNNLGMTEGQLAKCPDSPNCVSTQATTDEHAIPPIPFEGSGQQALDRLAEIINAEPRATVVTRGDNYLHAEFVSLVFRFVDDVEFYADESNKTLHFRSASRVGYSDMGPIAIEWNASAPLLRSNRGDRPKMNREQIEQTIGVRGDYLWLDEVVEIDDQRIHARKFLAPDLAVFQSHYVDFPLFPGALQCEASFQASAVLIARTQPITAGHVPVISRVRNTKFRRMARPGEMLNIHVEIEERAGAAFALRGRVMVGDNITTELKFTATEAPVAATVDK